MSPRASSTVAFAVLVAAVIYLYYDHALIASDRVGIAVQVAGIGLVVWARVTFGLRSLHFAANPTKGALVTHGAYRHTRNPVYTGALIAMTAGVVTHWSLVAGGVLFVCYLATLVRVLAEEKMLAAEYPEYADYRAKTRRFLPYLF